MTKWMKMGILCGLMGLACWGIIFLARVSYPHMLFRVLMPLGLFFVFFSLPLLALSWITTVYQDICAKNYLIAAFWIIGAVIWVLLEIPKFLS